nr:hypothetical protein [Tanacetum cinerariifolium]
MSKETNEEPQNVPREEGQHASVSTPMVTSRVLEEEIASPTELGKAYMRSRPSKKKCAFQMSAPEDDSFEIDDALAADIAELKECKKPVSSSEIDVGFGGSVSEHGLGFKLPASPPLTTNTQNNLLMDNVVQEKDSNSFPLFAQVLKACHYVRFLPMGL